MESIPVTASPKRRFGAAANTLAGLLLFPALLLIGVVLSGDACHGDTSNPNCHDLPSTLTSLIGDWVIGLLPTLICLTLFWLGYRRCKTKWGRGFAIVGMASSIGLLLVIVVLIFAQLTDWQDEAGPSYGESYCEGCDADGKGGKRGYKSLHGDILVPAQFDYIVFNRTTPALYVVEQNGKRGLLDGHGKVLVSPRYDEIGGHDYDGNYLLFKDKGKYGYLDRQGQVHVKAQYEHASGLAYDATPFLLNGLWGFLAKDGSVRIPPQFKRIGSEDRGMTGTDLVPVAATEGHWGLIDVTGKFVTQSDFKQIHSGFTTMADAAFASMSDERLVGACLENGRCGMIDRTGAFVIPARFSNVGSRFTDSDALIGACVAPEKCGFINSSGVMEIEPKFENLSGSRFSKRGSAEETINMTSIGGKEVMVNRNGDVLVKTGN